MQNKINNIHKEVQHFLNFWEWSSFFKVPNPLRCLRRLFFLNSRRRLFRWHTIMTNDVTTILLPTFLADVSYHWVCAWSHWKQMTSPIACNGNTIKSQGWGFVCMNCVLLTKNFLFVAMQIFFIYTWLLRWLHITWLSSSPQPASNYERNRTYHDAIEVLEDRLSCK